MPSGVSHQESKSSSRSNSSDQAFPFQHDDHSTHQTLLPDGILNDDDDIVPWPRKSSKEDIAEKVAVLKVRKLPQDMTGREFAGLFLMADGYLDSELNVENDEVSRGTSRMLSNTDKIIANWTSEIHNDARGRKDEAENGFGLCRTVCETLVRGGDQCTYPSCDSFLVLKVVWKQCFYATNQPARELCEREE